ncbi:MAG: porin family protein [Chitinophagales bacterium]|nr:PorT family protein [Bacteroidota bacterium]MCB9042708.1 PorT family protein [Chitinophagales bacterium]
MQNTHIWHQHTVYCRQIIVAILIMISGSTALFGQKNLADHDYKKVYFGFLMGYNSTRFDIEHSADFINNDSIKVVESPTTPGFNLGIISNLKLAKRLDLRFIPTLVFAEKKLRYTEITNFADSTFTNTIESIYFDFPLSLKYKSDRFNDNFRFYIMAGIRLDYDLASNSKKRRANDIVKLGKYDWSGEVGFGFNFYFPMFIFSPEIKIARGLNNVHVPTDNYRYSEVLGALRSRTITVSIQFEG